MPMNMFRLSNASWGARLNIHSFEFRISGVWKFTLSNDTTAPPCANSRFLVYGQSGLKHRSYGSMQCLRRKTTRLEAGYWIVGYILNGTHEWGKSCCG